MEGCVCRSRKLLRGHSEAQSRQQRVVLGCAICGPRLRAPTRLRVCGGHASVAVCEESMLHVALQHCGHIKLHKVVHCGIGDCG